MPSDGYAKYYQDTGCSLHPSCLNCPQRRCRYDGEVDIVRHRRVSLRVFERNREIIMLRNKGKSSKDLAQSFGLCLSSIRQILRRGQP